MTPAQRQFRHDYPASLVPDADKAVFWALVNYWGTLELEAATESRLVLLRGLGEMLASRIYGRGSLAFEKERLRGVQANLARIRGEFDAQGIDPDLVPPVPQAPWQTTQWPRSSLARAS